MQSFLSIGKMIPVDNELHIDLTHALVEGQNIDSGGGKIRGGGGELFQRRA